MTGAEEWPQLFQRTPPEYQAAFILGTAYHEAGHVAARWWLDRTRYVARNSICSRVGRVTVSLDGVSLINGTSTVGLDGGQAFLTPGESLEPLSWPEPLPPGVRPPNPRRYRRLQKLRASAEIIALMAGPIAEFLHAGDPLSDAGQWLDSLDPEAAGEEPEDDYGSDHFKVTAVIPYLGRRWRLHLARAFVTADAVVRRYQGTAIRALAELLAERGSVEGEEAYAIFDAVAKALEAAGKR